MSLLPNCREVTRLVLEGEERTLSWPERVRINVHLKMCQACTHFTGQVRLMRAALGQWRQYGAEAPPTTPSLPPSPPQSPLSGGDTDPDCQR